MNPQPSSLLGQIQAAKREAQQLREFMKDAAREATLTFPSTKQEHPPVVGDSSERKD